MCSPRTSGLTPGCPGTVLPYRLARADIRNEERMMLQRSENSFRVAAFLPDKV